MEISRRNLLIASAAALPGRFFADFHTKHFPAIMREIGSMYDVDGFFTNSWPADGAPPQCYCQACRRAGKLTKAQLLDRSQARVRELVRNIDEVAREGRKER